ncbi:MAG: TatD family hydrolase [Gemmatimonadota bacterium]|nr:TatD family hydrolase [Gemmatimonadota bacterium]
MEYIDLHAHMVSRTTDDYVQMALTGCVALTEPAFWPGWDRSSADGFEDYFRQITEFEPARAAQYGIRHYTWLCLNPKEGENRELAREVLRRIPRYLDRPNVLGIGEIGLNRVTRNELETFKDHVELALEHDQLIHIHTPHLEDKYKGTRVIVDTLLKYDGIDPSRVLVDHAEEHTLGMILENGFWTGITLYPQTKTSPQRAIDMIEMHGPERICVASACDWGPSIPVAVPQFALEMRRRGHAEELIRRIVFGNPAEFLGQSPKFRLPGHSAVRTPEPRTEGASLQTEIGGELAVAGS